MKLPLSAVPFNQQGAYFSADSLSQKTWFSYHVGLKTHDMFLARRKRRAKNKSGFNEHLSQLDIRRFLGVERPKNCPTA